MPTKRSAQASTAWVRRAATAANRAFGIDRGLPFPLDDIVEDSEGLAAGLDERMQASIDAYRDPRQDRVSPATPGQFRVDEGGHLVIGLPVRAAAPD